jgi:hypothetical protein
MTEKIVSITLDLIDRTLLTVLQSPRARVCAGFAGSRRPV